MRLEFCATVVLFRSIGFQWLGDACVQHLPCCSCSSHLLSLFYQHVFSFPSVSSVVQGERLAVVGVTCVTRALRRRRKMKAYDMLEGASQPCAFPSICLKTRSLPHIIPLRCFLPFGSVESTELFGITRLSFVRRTAGVRVSLKISYCIPLP